MKEIEKLKIAIQIMQVNNCDLINIDSVQMAVEGVALIQNRKSC